MLVLPIDKVTPGMILGEDLMHGGSVMVPRGAALTDGQIARIRKFEITSVMIDDSEAQKSKTAGVGPKAVGGLAKRVVQPGEFVCVQGEPSGELFILVTGELDVIYTDEALFTEKMDAVDKIEIIRKHGKRITSIKGKMVNFGELGALLGQRRTATIAATVESVVASIPAVGDSFNNTVLKNPRLGLNISVTIAKRLKDINVFIFKYNSILSQVENMVKEFSTIYVSLAAKVLKKAIQTRDSKLEKIHEHFKLSPLYNRLLKYQKATIDTKSATQDTSVVDPNDSLFNHGNLVGKQAGEIVCYHGEVGDKMYILITGKLGVFVGDKMVSSYEKKGDIIGEISVLLGYASKNKGFDKRTATVKAISRSRLMCIESTEIDRLVDSNPGLVLHITRTLAERLKVNNQTFINSQKQVSEFMARLAVEEGSCGYEIDRILKLFSENVNTMEHCMNEVKVLQKMSSAINEQYQLVQERLGSLSV